MTSHKAKALRLIADFERAVIRLALDLVQEVEAIEEAKRPRRKRKEAPDAR